MPRIDLEVLGGARETRDASVNVTTVANAALLAAIIGGAFALTRGGQPAEAAGAQDIRFLGSAILKQDASAGDTTNMLLSLNSGALQHRSKCTALGGGAARLDIQVRSDKTGGMIMAFNGSQLLNDTFKSIWTVQGNSAVGFGQSYDDLYRDGTYRHFEVSFAVKHGRDCVSHIVATTA